MTHYRLDCVRCRSACACGSAMFTTGTSRMAISDATEIAASAIQRHRSVVSGAGVRLRWSSVLQCGRGAWHDGETDRAPAFVETEGCQCLLRGGELVGVLVP